MIDISSVWLLQSAIEYWKVWSHSARGSSVCSSSTVNTVYRWTKPLIEWCWSLNQEKSTNEVGLEIDYQFAFETSRGLDVVWLNLLEVLLTICLFS